MKSDWWHTIHDGDLHWAVEIEDLDGYVFIELGWIFENENSEKRYETRQQAREGVKRWYADVSSPKIKRATVIRIRIAKENLSMGMHHSSSSWFGPITLDKLSWAVEVQEVDNENEWVEFAADDITLGTREKARERARFWRTRDYVKRATVIRVRVVKEMSVNLLAKECDKKTKMAERRNRGIKYLCKMTKEAFKKDTYGWRTFALDDSERAALKDAMWVLETLKK